jgi:hypothetical protein
MSRRSLGCNRLTIWCIGVAPRSTRLRSRRRGKSHLFSPAQHLKPAIVFRRACLIGLGLLVHQFGVEDGAQLCFERCTLRRVLGGGTKVGQLLGIGFKIEELRRRANIIDVLMPQIAQHVERIGAVGVELRQHGPVLRRLSGEIQQRHARQAQLRDRVRRTDRIKDGRGDVAQGDRG